MDKEQAIEKIASRIIVTCGEGTVYPCPHTPEGNPFGTSEMCKHEDKDICIWQIEQATEFVNILEQAGYQLKPPDDKREVGYDSLVHEIHKISEEYYSVEHSSGGVSFYEYLARRLQTYLLSLLPMEVLGEDEIRHILETQKYMCDTGKTTDDGRCSLCRSIETKLQYR